MIFYFLTNGFVTVLNRIRIKNRNPNIETFYYEKKSQTIW